MRSPVLAFRRGIAAPGTLVRGLRNRGGWRAGVSVVLRDVPAAPRGDGRTGTASAHAQLLFLNFAFHETAARDGNEQGGDKREHLGLSSCGRNGLFRQWLGLSSRLEPFMVGVEEPLPTPPEDEPFSSATRPLVPLWLWWCLSGGGGATCAIDCRCWRCGGGCRCGGWSGPWCSPVVPFPCPACRGCRCGGGGAPL